MMGKTFCDRFKLKDVHSLGIKELTLQAGLRVTDFSHDETAMLEGKNLEEISRDKSKYVNSRILFLTRNLKDLLVSCYFQASRRINRFDGGISEFIRDERYGARKILTFYQHWHEGKNTPEEFTWNTYEEMHENTEGVLVNALHLSDFVATQSELEQSIAFARFEELKRLETKGYFQSGILTPANAADPESFKIRKGEVGGYVDYLSPEDVAYIDEMESSFGNPFISKKSVID